MPKTTKKSKTARTVQAGRDARQFGTGLNAGGMFWFGKDKDSQAKKAGVDGFTGAAVTKGSARKATKHNRKKAIAENKASKKAVANKKKKASPKKKTPTKKK